MEYDDEGLLVDRLLPTLVHCCSRASAELLGIVKLPLLLILVFLGQVTDKTLVMRVDQPACLIIRLLVGFASDSVFVKLNKNIEK